MFECQKLPFVSGCALRQAQDFALRVASCGFEELESGEARKLGSVKASELIELLEFFVFMGS